jgi:hypothetical protein
MLAGFGMLIYSPVVAKSHKIQAQQVRVKNAAQDLSCTLLWWARKPAS